MRSTFTWCTALGLAAAFAPSAVGQDHYEGKSADELLEFVRKRIADREGDEDTGQAYSRFRNQKSREFAQRVGVAAAAWENEVNDRRTPLGRALLMARVLRAFGDFKACNNLLQSAYRKASQSPLQKQLAAIELAKMFQLRGDTNDAVKWVSLSQSDVKDPRAGQWLKEEGAKIAKMSIRLKEYQEWLEKRAAAPRDPAVQLQLCEHLRNFTDAGPRFLQGGQTRALPYLLVELYVNYEWFRQTFPTHKMVTEGGIDSFMLDQAVAAHDMITAMQAATRLLANPKNGRASSGQLMQDMAILFSKDSAMRGKSLLCWRALVERYASYPSVAGGQAQKQVRELSKEPKLRNYAKVKVPAIPWE